MANAIRDCREGEDSGYVQRCCASRRRRKGEDGRSVDAGGLSSYIYCNPAHTEGGRWGWGVRSSGKGGGPYVKCKRCFPCVAASAAGTSIVVRQAFHPLEPIQAASTHHTATSTAAWQDLPDCQGGKADGSNSQALAARSINRINCAVALQPAKPRTR